MILKLSEGSDKQAQRPLRNQILFHLPIRLMNLNHSELLERQTQCLLRLLDFLSVK